MVPTHHLLVPVHVSVRGTMYSTKTNSAVALNTKTATTIAPSRIRSTTVDNTQLCGLVAIATPFPQEPIAQSVISCTLCAHTTGEFSCWWSVVIAQCERFSIVRRPELPNMACHGMVVPSDQGVEVQAWWLFLAAFCVAENSTIATPKCPTTFHRLAWPWFQSLIAFTMALSQLWSGKKQPFLI